MMRIAERQKLGWLEFGRGMAALLVVISHGSMAGVPERFWQFILSLGSSAVAFFFVLSGFIILYIHGRDMTEQRTMFGGARFEFFRLTGWCLQSTLACIWP
jgi:exopolysaccharide production protein ExoZ